MTMTIKKGMTLRKNVGGIFSTFKVDKVTHDMTETIVSGVYKHFVKGGMVSENMTVSSEVFENWDVDPLREIYNKNGKIIQENLYDSQIRVLIPGWRDYDGIGGKAYNEYTIDYKYGTVSHDDCIGRYNYTIRHDLKGKKNAMAYARSLV